MKVTIRYMDDSISVLEIEEDSITFDTDANYFILQNDDEQPLGWIVKENVKYVIIGELIDDFKDKIKEKKEGEY